MVHEVVSNEPPLSLRQRLRAFVYPSPADAAGASARKKPPNLLYDVDDVPPPLVLLGHSVQHIFLMSLGWLYVAVIVNAVGGTPAAAESLIRMSMIAGGLATMLQASRTRMGSGYLCPVSGSLTYLQPSIFAARTGGFSLLFGMVAAAGIATTLLSRLAQRLRVLFPPEVTGLMVAMSGLQLISLAFPRFVGFKGAGAAPDLSSVAVGAITLLAMIGATVWLRGKLHVLPILVGLVSGFAMALATGVLPWGQLTAESNGAWISLPRRVTGGLAFQFSLLVPFLIASLTASLKTVGDLTLCQKINDADWKRTDMRSVSGGMFANGSGTFLSGLFGGAAQNTVTSSVGLSLATGVTSRSIAIPTGLLVIALAFFPKLAAIFAAMPMPVMGAVLIYSACFIILGGFQLLTSRMLDARRIFVIGISLIFGLSVETSPEIYRLSPEALRPIFSSSTSLATVLVVVLSLLFRFGVSRQRSVVFRPRNESFDSIHNVMHEQGALWGMRHEVEQRAEHAVQEALNSIVLLNPLVREIEIQLEFDELSFDATLDYQGASPVLSESAPTPEEMATEEGIAALSGFLIRQYADKVRVRQRGSTGSRITLHFDH